MAELWSLAGMRALSVPLCLAGPGQQLRSGQSPSPTARRSLSTSETPDGVCGEGFSLRPHLLKPEMPPRCQILCSFLVWGRVGQPRVNILDREELDNLF